MPFTAVLGSVLALAGALAALVDAVWVLTRAEMSDSELLTLWVAVGVAGVGALLLALPALVGERRRGTAETVPDDSPAAPTVPEAAAAPDDVAAPGPPDEGPPPDEEPVSAP